MKRILLGIVAIVFVLIVYSIYEDHQRFKVFAAKREAWKQRCEPYLTVPLSNPTARSCNVELEALVAEADLNGW